MEAFARLADPEFDSPGKIDLLLGVDVFIRVLLNGWQCGPPGSPTALQSLAGCWSVESGQVALLLIT